MDRVHSGLPLIRRTVAGMVGSAPDKSLGMPSSRTKYSALDPSGMEAVEFNDAPEVPPTTQRGPIRARRGKRRPPDEKTARSVWSAAAIGLEPIHVIKRVPI